MNIEEIKDKADYVVGNSLKEGADDVIANASSGKTTQIKFANNEIVQTHTWDSVDIDVFLAFKKRIVSTTISDFQR